ncbi:unnamed protein product [Caenorhabditis angaria]|uniref:G-protein coupled receptors family 1 profile domain-containing protein n=1 Tax=Caenorhabditis angaria TaxID=860376 RepID=A0A9P1N868_9PELO|nr:unnamed protein product [Caenorhabditis angaria]
MTTIEPESVLVIVVYSALAITGFLGNMWVLMTVSMQLIGCSSNRARTYKSVVQSSAYIYLLLLSIVDLLSLIPVPMLVADIYKNKFEFGDFWCKVLYICEGMNKTLSPMVLMALSIDRYIAVCHPTLYWMRETRFALCVVLVSSSLSMLFLVPITRNAVTQYMIDNNNKEVMKCAFEAEFFFFFDLMHTVVCYLIPLTVICAVYLAILLKLYKHTRFSAVGQKTSISLSRVVKCSVMVVAFYFICWTPYWIMRIHLMVITMITKISPNPENTNFTTAAPNLNATTVSYHFAVEETTVTTVATKKSIDFEIVLMYMLHALPYAQSAFNWLFYAFLNRNLRNSTSRCLNGTRSAATTSAVDNAGVTSTMNTSLTPIWKNIQQMGTQIKSAGIDTGNALLKKSPFRGRSRIQSRSAAYLDCSQHQLRASSQLNLSSSLLDIPRRPSLIPRQEPSLVGKALSYTNLPQPSYQLIDQKEESSHGMVSESSSVEWL